MATTTQVELAPISISPLNAGEGLLLSTAQDTAPPPEPPVNPVPSRLKTTAIILTLAGVNFTNSGTNGLVGVGLPAIADSLNLPPHLALWPASASSLATASTLLLCGSLATALGPRAVDLVGCFAAAALMAGAAGAQTGESFVALRALQGVALAMHQASSVAIIVENLPRGRGRNVAFSCLGLSQPLGYSFGLVLGGVFVDTVGWRAGWYLYGGITLVLAVLGLWSLPARRQGTEIEVLVRRLTSKVDWIGAALASCAMASLSYLLA